MPIVGAGPEVPPQLADQIAKDFGVDASFSAGDVGNRHLVIRADRQLDEAETAQFGLRYESHFDDGINVEFVWPIENQHSRLGRRVDVGMTVWERGAGITKACGSGAVVAAARAREWFVPPNQTVVSVRMPGAHANVGYFEEGVVPGDLRHLGLVVSTHHVADIEWPLHGPWLDA